MPLYKDENENLYSLDSPEFEYLLPADCVEITDEEAAAIHQSNIIPPTYQELRAAEYPDFRLYLDGVVKNDQQQIQDYIDACLAVKAKYPNV